MSSTPPTAQQDLILWLNVAAKMIEKPIEHCSSQERDNILSTLDVLESSMDRFRNDISIKNNEVKN